MTPETCPECKADFRDGKIKDIVGEEAAKHYVGGGKGYFYRVIGIVDIAKDHIVQWRCPDCGHVWERKWPD